METGGRQGHRGFMAQAFTYLWLAGKEGMGNNMENMTLLGAI